MAIHYKEKGIGLHEKILNSGHQLYELDGVWYSDDDIAVQQIIDTYNDSLPSEDLKITGIEICGVMCSATGRDQSGLVALLMAIQLQGAAFKPTNFEFENGNKLLITLSNYKTVIDTWLPFRQSFFLQT